MKFLAILIISLAAFIPAQAFAHCGATVSGSYVVTCERGVKVYRHHAKSSVSMTTNADISRRDQLEAKRYSQAVRAQQRAKAQSAKAAQMRVSQRIRNRVYLGSRYNDYRGFGTNNFRTARFTSRRRTASRRMKH